MNYFKIVLAATFGFCSFATPTFAASPDVYVVNFRSDTSSESAKFDPKLAPAIAMAGVKAQEIIIDISTGATWEKSAHDAYDHDIVPVFNKWVGLPGFAVVIDANSKRVIGCLNALFDVSEMAQELREMASRASGSAYISKLSTPTKTTKCPAAFNFEGSNSKAYEEAEKRGKVLETPAPFATPAPTERFDAANVDRNLYPHQRVGGIYSIMGKKYKPKHEPKYDEEGLASWYGDKFHGKPTATGEIFDKYELTAAHKTLPLNSMLHITNLDTGESALVRLIDRGPFNGRLIDLSEEAARELNVLEAGMARVRVRYAGPADPMASTR